MRSLRTNTEVSSIRTGTLEHACQRYDLGRNTMRKVAEDAGAVIKIGRCVRINFDRVDHYMETISK